MEDLYSIVLDDSFCEFNIAPLPVINQVKFNCG